MNPISIALLVASGLLFLCGWQIERLIAWWSLGLIAHHAHPKGEMWLALGWCESRVVVCTNDLRWEAKCAEIKLFIFRHQWNIDIPGWPRPSRYNDK